MREAYSKLLIYHSTTGPVAIAIVVLEKKKIKQEQRINETEKKESVQCPTPLSQKR